MSYENNEDLLGDILDCSGDEDNDRLEHEDEGEPSGESETLPEKVEVKKRITRNPQPKLNSQRLSGPRGIHVIEQHFRDFKFKGKHHEHTDLNKIMKRLEHWAHRLFPKYQFDDCIEKLERLGKQRVVISYMNMYRHGNLQLDENIENVDRIADGDVEEDVLATPLDEMDELLNEQIAFARTSHIQNHDATFDSLIQTPSSKFGFSPKPTSTPYHSKHIEHGHTAPTLTREQLETIALNKKRAQEKLLLRKQMEAEAAAKQANNIQTDDIDQMDLEI